VYESAPDGERKLVAVVTEAQGASASSAADAGGLTTSAPNRRLF
jgi:hypothetical protein